MDHRELANRVELFLLSQSDWTSVEEVCAACDVPDRLLRADGKRRPIHTRFAISSSTKGIKHLSRTTARERITYKHARLKNLISYRRALDEFNEAVSNCLTGKFPNQTERFTHQATLFPL